MMKAIVLTCDKYIRLADHMIHTYQRIWPDNPFQFRVPYGEYPHFLKEKYGEKIELIQTEAAKVIHPVENPIETAKDIKKVSLVKQTMLSLLEDIPDEEWIFWCMDDRYLIKLRTAEVNDLYQYIIAANEPDICLVTLSRKRRFLKPEYLKEGGEIITKNGQKLLETIYTNTTKVLDIWEHQFVRAKILRRIFKSFPDRAFIPKEMDFFVKEKLIGEKCYVPEKNIIVFGESTNRGQLTENCVASHKKWKLEIPNNFEISQKYHVTGELPYRLFSFEITLPNKIQKKITSLTRWYWRNI